MNELERDALTVLMHRQAMPEHQRKPDLADAAEKRLAFPMGVLEQHLQAQSARKQTHLAAERFTVADLCAASVVLWMRPAKALMAQHPLTSAWLARCLARPAYRALRASIQP